MTDMVQPTVPALGLFARAVGVIVSPVDTFKAVVAHPRPVGILFLVCLAMAIAVGGPQFTESGKRAALDMQVQQIERSTGNPISPEQYTAMERFSAFSGYIAMGAIFVMIPVVTVIFTALYWAVFNIALGGNATFGQVLAVNTHSQVITALGTLIGVPLQMMQGTFTPAGPFNLGVLAPMLDPASGLALFLGALTFFGIWQTIVAGLGLGVLYKRAPAGIIIGLLIIYLAFTALFSVGLSSVMGR